MPEKFGQKLLWVVITSLFTLIVGFLLLNFTARGEKWTSTEEAIESKATIEYVDKQDFQIEKDLITYKEDHKELHALNQKQMDLTVTYLERMMDNLNIQYRDLKYDINEGRRD